MKLFLRPVQRTDIPIWCQLSHEYDPYVIELVSDLSHWYDGNESDTSFIAYMESKIKKEEAFMAVNTAGEPFGIIAFSRINNRITFIGVFHNRDFFNTGKVLLDYAMLQLDKKSPISINVIKSKAEHIKKEMQLIKQYGFQYSNDELENGVPVEKMIRDEGMIPS